MTTPLQGPSSGCFRRRQRDRERDGGKREIGTANRVAGKPKRKPKSP